LVGIVSLVTTILVVAMVLKILNWVWGGTDELQSTQIIGLN